MPSHHASRARVSGTGPAEPLTKQLQERVADVFEAGNAAPAAPPIDVKVLHAKVG